MYGSKNLFYKKSYIKKEGYNTDIDFDPNIWFMEFIFGGNEDIKRIDR